MKHLKKIKKELKEIRSSYDQLNATLQNILDAINKGNTKDAHTNRPASPSVYAKTKKDNINSTTKKQHICKNCGKVFVYPKALANHSKKCNPEEGNPEQDNILVEPVD